MKDYSEILYEAYGKFLLPLGGKLVPTPYRENNRGALQKIGSEFQGKSSPEVLVETTKRLAREQKFDLDKAKVEQIRAFMIKNKLGIDCSGFIYRVLNTLTQKVFGKPLTSMGFEHVGRTNVRKFTSDEMSVKVKKIVSAKPGDLIRLRWDKDPNRLHALIILNNENDAVTYAHSTEVSQANGVHTSQIRNGKLGEDLKAFLYNKKAGDGIRRLKILI